MTRTFLSEHLAARGARLGEYGGAETASAFGDPQAEFVALRSASGVFDLGWRAKLAATGEDRVRWMNGMVTGNVRDLAPNRGAYSFLLNPQGHILGDLYIYNRGDHLLLDTDSSQAPRLREVFEKYIIMDDVAITDISEKLTAIGLRGPNASAVLGKCGLNAGTLEPLELRDTTLQDIGVSLVRSAGRDPGYEIWLTPQNAANVWDALVAAGATPVGTEAWEMCRIAAGLPRYGQDIRERDLPQETEQHQALDFSKGCYVGQEIVERIRSRGQVHRKFTGFRLKNAGAGAAAPGTKIQAEGKDVGELTSVASLPQTDGTRTTIALGYVRRELTLHPKALKAGEATVTVAELPFAL
ncbi:MAG TPA: folate-binding protein [Terriglobales bacterium]|nr:folate-binding protein [Terriglobales bacterium]